MNDGIIQPRTAVECSDVVRRKRASSDRELGVLTPRFNDVSCSRKVLYVTRTGSETVSGSCNASQFESGPKTVASTISQSPRRGFFRPQCCLIAHLLRRSVVRFIVLFFTGDFRRPVLF